MKVQRSAPATPKRRQAPAKRPSAVPAPRVIAKVVEKVTPNIPKTNFARKLSRGLQVAPPTGRIEFAAVLYMIRNANNRAEALQAVLLYLASRFQGAILFRDLDDTLKPWCSCGKLADWDATQQLAIAKNAACTVASTARSPVPIVDQPGGRHMDVLLAKLTAGDDKAPRLAFAALCGTRVQGVYYAFAPTTDLTETRREVGQLQRELGRVLYRLHRPDTVQPQRATA